MPSWPDDKFRYFVACSVAAAVTCAIVAVLMLLLPRRKRYLLRAFIRENWITTFSTTLLAIPSAGFGGILFGGLLVIAISTVSGHVLARQTRLLLACISAIPFYLGFLIYVGRYLFKEVTKLAAEEDWKIACHEAGHAVAAVRQMICFDTAKVGPNEFGEVSPTWNPIDDEDRDWTDSQRVQYQLVYAAGAAAERLIFGRER